MSEEVDILIEKVRVYEDLLHRIQLFAEVSLQPERMRKIISDICGWSYAHRVGNGELSDEEQEDRVRTAFEKLKKSGL